MLNVTITPFIWYLHSFSPEVVCLFTYIACYISITVFTLLWKSSGLYLYGVVAILASNMQVLKAMQLSFYDYPVPLGTIIFTTTFLASDALNELFGASAARRLVFLSFAASILMLVFMTLAVGVKPLNIEASSEYGHFNVAHNALKIIFTPNIAILIASITSYFISQFTDIAIFSKLKSSNKRHLWFRGFVSIAIACLLDTVIFSTLAWYIFNPKSVDLHTLIFTYILGGYTLQLITAFLNTPMLYILRAVGKI
jgi:uncharacterized integral membrane protein (TIGR00697 family)